MSGSESDDCLVLPDPELESDSPFIVINTKQELSSGVSQPATTPRPAPPAPQPAVQKVPTKAVKAVKQSPSICAPPPPVVDKSANPEEPDSDTETISTIDLCQAPKKKVQVSLSTYIARPNKAVESTSLKPQLEKLNSKSSITVTSMLSRDSKRRRVEVIIQWN